MLPLSKKQQTIFLITIAMMLMIGIVSSDIYLPSMPYMKNDFHVSYSAIQHTLLYYLIGLSIMQLMAGPLSDRFGKKRTLLLGLIIYLLASFGCAFSSSIIMLYIFRLLQAIGASAILVIGRKIVTDSFTPETATKIYSIVLPIVSLSPATAPVLGGFIQSHLGWRANFIFLILFAIILLPLSFYCLKLVTTTQAKIKNINLLHRYLILLKAKTFLKFTLFVSIAYFMWFAYLADSAHIYHAFSLNATQIGFCYISQSIAAISGTYTGTMLLKRISSQQLFTLAIINGLISAILILTIASFSLWIFLLAITLMAFTNGIMITFGISFAMREAVQTCQAVSGTASGLVGSLQIAGGAVGALAASLLAPTIEHLGILLMICLLFAFVMVISPTYSR